MKHLEFLKLLTRAVHLYQNVRIFNTVHKTFKYDLKEDNGQLILYVSFPNHERVIKIHSAKSPPPEVEDMFSDVEEYIAFKRAIIKERGGYPPQDTY